MEKCMKNIETTEQMHEWIVSAQPGSSCVYFNGLLMRSRAELDPARPIPADLMVARKMWALYIAGRVTLVQKRVGDFNYQYMAQKIV
jgi:hypothetical protein